MKYWRVSLSAASIDSDPPHVNQAFVRPSGASDTRSRSERFHRLIGKKACVSECEPIDLGFDGLRTRALLWPRHDTAAPPEPSR